MLRKKYSDFIKHQLADCCICVLAILVVAGAALWIAKALMFKGAFA
ncbi:MULTISPECIES: hypothetical protein [unclassified Duganella]|nr:MULTISPECIES: hypothetical protein [unclassified Duganella]